MHLANRPAVRDAMRWDVRTAGCPAGVVTVEVQGTPVAEALGRLADEVASHTSAGSPVLIDLDGLVMTGSAAMRGFITGLNERGAGPNVALLCSRPTGRQLLRRWVSGPMRVVSQRTDIVTAPISDAMPATVGRR